LRRVEERWEEGKRVELRCEEKNMELRKVVKRVAKGCEKLKFLKKKL
jgi:hypothetical protein